MFHNRSVEPSSQPRPRTLGENHVEASLSFKLHPAIARGFGKAGIGMVEASEGQLVDAEITGTDAATQIDQLDTQREDIQGQIARIDIQLPRSGLRAEERAELQRQRAALQGESSAVRDSTREQRERLANTPMTFDYRSGKAIRGFDLSAPFSSALDMLVGSAQVTLATLLGLLALVGPPALVFGLGWLVWRRVRPAPRARSRSEVTDTEHAG